MPALLTLLAAACSALAAPPAVKKYVKPGLPPFLFIHGTKDMAVPYKQSPMMCDKLKAAGNRCEIFTVEGAPHGVGRWEKNPEWQGYKVKMADWLRQTLK